MKKHSTKIQQETHDLNINGFKKCKDFFSTVYWDNRKVPKLTSYDWNAFEKEVQYINVGGWATVVEKNSERQTLDSKSQSKFTNLPTKCKEIIENRKTNEGRKNKQTEFTTEGKEVKEKAPTHERH